MVDQRVTRPGPTASPRKLHLLHRLHTTPGVRATPATQECDERPGGGHEVGAIEWVDHRACAGPPLFPPIGRALAALPTPRAVVADAALAAVTDDDYVWV
ncbi:hypothetical protein ACFO4E_04315 [Nocardiopsis mangrovi]|uniref:Uncharacterized protein n=1 Tax=Nocardiopsis mangrovi TaxID=1179818 RepID=A0ABV9DQF4_9ACTN